MKKIQYLTSYELYKYIFNPIFGFKVIYPKSWNIQNILNGETLPNPFLKNGMYKDIEDDIQKYLEQLKIDAGLKMYEPLYSLPSNLTNKYYEYKNKILENNMLYEDFELPVFTIKLEEDYIIIFIEYIINYRCRNEFTEIKNDKYKHYILFYDNGDIKISNEIKKEYRISFFDKSTYNQIDNTPKYLSYSQTKAMHKYFNELKIDITKELNYSI